MDTTNRYPLKLEGLRRDITKSEVSDFLDGPPTDILENVEFSHGPTTTAFLVLTRPDVAYEFLNFKELRSDGNRVTLKPELFEETSMTLNGAWLREIEDENPTIQIEIQKIADNYGIELTTKKSVQGNLKTISLAGVPWKIELARARLNDKLQAIITKRSKNVQTKSNNTPIHPDTAGNQSGQSTPNVNDRQIIDGQGKPALKLDDRQSSVDLDPNPGVEAKVSTEADSTNPSRKRVRALVKPIETETEASAGVGSTSDNDVIKEQPKENKRNRVLVSKPEETQKSDSSGMSTPVDYPASTQHQIALRVDTAIDRYLLEHSELIDFVDCSVTQCQVSEQHIDWIIENNNKTDLHRNEEGLRRLIDGLDTKCYTAPDEFDFEIFRDCIERDNTNKEVTLIFDSKDRSCKIVGRPDNVKRTYKWINDVSGELYKRCKQKSGKGPASESGDSRTGGSSVQQFDAQQRGPKRYPQDCKSHSSDAGNKQGPFTNLRGKVTKPGDGIHISEKSSKDRLEFTTRGNLRVSVYQGNMIKQPTEVIVNPANEYLAHAGGLARVILDAGGPVIDVESRDIISKQGKVQTSEVVHTSAGNLPPPIKYVIHAVGPTAHEFKDNKAGLVPTLKITFRNCLEYANDQLFVSSISLPPISSGIFAVPMPDIIQGAVEAIQDFDQKNPSAVLKEVHFISNDAKTTGEMIACFRKVIG